MGLTITKEKISELEIEKFRGNIIIVDKAEDVDAAIDCLIKYNKLGFDTETKPAFRKGQVNKVALLQLSSENTCYLFRLNMIGYPDRLDEIICNPDIKKIGLSLRDDFAAINKRSDKKPNNFVDLQPFVDEYGIDDNSLQRIYAIIFGKKISKRQRVTNWEVKELSEAQKNYAAIDAWACLRIYNHLIKNGNK